MVLREVMNRYSISAVNLVVFTQVIRQVSCGAFHVVALSDDGLLQAWGKFWTNFCDLNSNVQFMFLSQ